MKTQILLGLVLSQFLSCGVIGRENEDPEEEYFQIDTIPRPSIDTSRKNIILESLFDDDSDFLRGFMKGQSCCDYSVQRVNGSLRFELRKDDEPVSGSVRAEITGKGYKNEERWYGFRMRLEDWEMDEAGEHVIQWHPNDSRGSANLALWTSSGVYTLVISPHGNDNRYYELGPVVPNVPVDFVFHVKWTRGKDGFIEVWKDGKYVTSTQNNKTLPYRGITTWNGCYLKLGINKFGWSYEPSRSESRTKKRVLYFDEFREGNEKAQYADVAPGN